MRRKSVISHIWVRVVFFLSLSLTISLGHAQQPASPPQGMSSEARSDESWQHLETLVTTINSTREQLSELRAELRKSEDETERLRLTAEIDQLSSDLGSLQVAWEMLATGGTDLQLFGVKTETAFNWRDELQSVFEPILLELKKLTERPRKIERLRTEQGFYQQRFDAAELALQSVLDYRQEAPTPQLQNAFAGLEDRWRKRRDTLKSRLDLINFELEQMFAPSKGAQRDPVDALKELLSGRVLNLLIAVGVMAFVYFLMKIASRVYLRMVMSKKRRRRAFVSRLGALLFHLLTIFLVILSGMSVLYVFGDWLLLGVFIIILVGAAWAIQRSLPHYLMEAKLILNLGSVREGERLIYRDLPWRVKNLNFFTILENPCLEGGVLHIPLAELVDYNSRQFEPNEPWFPTEVMDFVILDDGCYGQVVSQTPENVHIKTKGSVKAYRTTTFLEQSPRNLSRHGFSLLMTFGLDYQHQAQITTSIRETMQRELIEGLSLIGLGKNQTSFSVEFKEAAASSLDLLVIANFNAEVADKYYLLQRLLQQLAVEACNRHGWVIPFNQITVHQANA